MAIILKTSKRFISIRWKLVSTYLLLVILTVVLMSSFMGNTIKNSTINERKTTLMTQLNILSNQIGPNYYGIQNDNTRSYLQELVKGYSLDINSRILLLDIRGKVLIDSYDDKLDANLVAIPQVRSAIYGENSYGLYKMPSGENVMYVSVPVTDRSEVIGVILTSSSIDDIIKSAAQTMSRIFLLSLIGLAITGFVSFVFADVISKPIEHMRVLVTDFGKGKFDTKITSVSNDEVGQLADAFNNMAAQINEVDEQRKQFVSNVSHELRTPLTSLKIISDSLLSQEHWDEGIYREFLGDIDSEVLRLSKIIDSLLYLVDIEKKELLMEYQVCHMNQLVMGVIKQLKPIADQKNTLLIFTQEDQVMNQVDQGKIQQCLINIVSNAIKYTPESGKVTVTLSQDKGHAIIVVTDNGMGIPEEDIPYVFDRFYRVDRARARTTGGTGLGLSIVKQIVNLHHGDITVESQLNAGTTVTVKLPIKS